jgi:hypothetical protein
VYLEWSAREIANDQLGPVAGTCWRVVDASPGSGWTAGQRFGGEAGGVDMNVMGFARPITVEGRVLGDGGSLLFAIEPETFALDKAGVLDAAASTTIAVASAKAWVEPDALHFEGARIPTDEILDATTIPIFRQGPITVHRTSTGLVRRQWWGTGEQPQFSDVALGAGTRARIANFGKAIVVDSELLIVGSAAGGETVLRRIPLGAEPREVVGNLGSVTLHMDGALVEYDDTAATVRSLTVGDGVLLPTVGPQRPMFFDGTTFHTVGLGATSLELDDLGSFTPRPDELAAAGAPVAVLHGFVLGEHGFLAAVDATTTVAGPRFASYADLLGEPGARIGPVATDSTAYVITRPDGSAALYNAPYLDYCD